MSDFNPPPQKNLRVLISGAGIGGLVAAYWLAKAGASVSVLERADALRTEGHIIGIREQALRIIEYMGLGEALRGQNSGELGLKLVDVMNRALVTFPVNDPDKGFTTRLQVRRGELVAALYEVTKDKVRFIFGNSVETVEEVDDSLLVTLVDRESQPLHVDVLLVAEGRNSRTRAKIFNEDVHTPLLRLGVRAAIFSFKSNEKWARCYHTPNSQALLVRPDRLGMAHVIAAYRASSDQLMADRKMTQDQQRQLFIRRFQGTGWESDKIMKTLSKTEHLHIQELAQVRCKTWSKGRVALVGDSAHCPSPIGGMGTAAAIVGGYNLAAELVKNPKDPQAAFNAYEASLRPWIEAIQKPAPLVAKLGLPETRFGICCFHFLFSVPLCVLRVITTILRLLGIARPDRFPNTPSPSVFSFKSLGNFKVE
ncbi:uncharacterized protein VP01_1504g4 [Puccinia sorghi]|uniref:FAD-binding domain-containing protein n=1 Tax=Puccinia sorghi TaxID=27349 RepID=A0A0L6VJ73_9BASI|nr:uncharacterized protein VP01_1504g4 [Puccinia sorghi]